MRPQESSLPNLHHRTQPRVGHNCSFTNPHSSDITFNLLLDVRAISFSSQNSLLHIASSIAVHRRLQPSAASTASCATRSQKIDMLRSWDQLSFRNKSASSIHHFIKIDDTITHLSTTTHISTRPNETLPPPRRTPSLIDPKRSSANFGSALVHRLAYIWAPLFCPLLYHPPKPLRRQPLPTLAYYNCHYNSANHISSRVNLCIRLRELYENPSGVIPISPLPSNFQRRARKRFSARLPGPIRAALNNDFRRSLCWPSPSQTNWLIQHSSQTSKEVLVRYRRMVPPLPCVAAGDSLQQCRPSRPVSNVVDSASPNNPPSPALTTSCAFSTLLFQPDSTDPDRRAVPDHGPAAWAVNATVTVAAAVDPAIAARAREVRWGRLSARLLEVIIFE